MGDHTGGSRGTHPSLVPQEGAATAEPGETRNPRQEAGPKTRKYVNMFNEKIKLSFALSVGVWRRKAFPCVDLQEGPKDLLYGRVEFTGQK